MSIDSTQALQLLLPGEILRRMDLNISLHMRRNINIKFMTPYLKQFTPSIIHEPNIRPELVDLLIKVNGRLRRTVSSTVCVSLVIVSVY